MIHDFLKEYEMPENAYIFAHSFEYYLKISTCAFQLIKKRAGLFRLGAILYINRMEIMKKAKRIPNHMSCLSSLLIICYMHMQMFFFFLLIREV